MQLKQHIDPPQPTGKASKQGLRIPCKFQPSVSLGDIIAATIGPDVRHGDLVDETDFSLPPELNDLSHLANNSDDSFHTPHLKHIQTPRKKVTNGVNAAANILTTLDTPGKTINGHVEDRERTWWGDYNSDNACDAFPSLVEPDFLNRSIRGTSDSSDGFGVVPETLGSNSHSTNSLLDTHSSHSCKTPNSLYGKTTPDTEGKLDFSSMLSFQKEEDGKQCIAASTEEQTHNTVEHHLGENVTSAHDLSKLSYDSDLEDSMHFVDPDDTSLYEPTPSSPTRKKRRLSEIGTSEQPDISYQNTSFPDLDTLINSEPSELSSLLTQSRSRSLHRSLSVHTNRHRRLSHHQSSTNLKNFCRTRSFSGTGYHGNSSPPLDRSLNSSLTSLCENSSLSNHPFFSDLQSTLLSDCQTNECPKTLFETLTHKSDYDVYARERALLAKFSSLTSRYPDEIQDLSKIYRTQSAEVEAERLREIHGENVAISYKRHLNQYYDNQLHKIIDRVEKSLQLLSVAQRNIVTASRGVKSRPILSRRAVRMMEEWYERNLEHPYPGPSAVEALARAGEINPEQVKKWFANKRNRSKNVKPMSEVMNLKRKRQFSAQW